MATGGLATLLFGRLARGNEPVSSAEQSQAFVWYDREQAKGQGLCRKAESASIGESHSGAECGERKEQKGEGRELEAEAAKLFCENTELEANGKEPTRNESGG